MKRFCMSVCALTCFAALALPCMAQANPWNGSWKIDPATVKYDGPTFSVATDAHGFTVTRDGKAGVQTGEMVVIRKTGIERLHAIPRGFAII